MAKFVNRFLVLGHLLLLAGCESDGEKLARLEMDATISCLAANGDARTASTDYPGSTPEQIEQRRINARESRARCVEAERKLRRFLD